MEVNCEGCAGCCIDWRPLLDPAVREAIEHERRGPRRPLDDTYNLVPLTRDEVRAFLEAGLGDALTPRLWRASEADGIDGRVEVDGRELAAVAGRPAFFVGLRKPPKPVAPFDREAAAWLPTCVFLDPTTLQCRIHDDDLYPSECAEYPAHNLALGQETECERVEGAVGGERLVDDAPDDPDAGSLLLGPQAIGQKVFVHPRPGDLAGRVDRLADDALSRADRAEFLAVAAASSPGTLSISEPHYERARARALAADSWAGRAIREWMRRRDGGETPDPDAAREVEDDRGAPGTPGWDAVEESVPGE
ncbi:YkgJ family cysteine cluster protein [Salinilacihabitans rarus]|uniref:YkgJ family cysteine cluster protein n=1 Tax=Salinilacihabitans rarus TaxID=2961596 RepID=UPI0020C8C654|nr:YkgJ family cysteine cluster protein [Salinilacihabitans rarus]